MKVTSHGNVFLRQYCFDLKTLHALVSRPRSMHAIVMTTRRLWIRLILRFDEKYSLSDPFLCGILAAHRAIIKANSHAIETGNMMRIIVPKTRSSVPNP